MGVLSSWLSERRLSRRASRYAAHALEEPPDGDVEWLASVATAGDHDHARWELRYARRALTLVTARHDALDDRTASAVAAALGVHLLRDPLIAPAKRDMAERQFNERLRAYADVLEQRTAPGRTARLGATLASFAGRPDAGADVYAAGGAILARYLAQAHHALAGAFGEAELPEHLLTGQTPAAKR